MKRSLRCSKCRHYAAVVADYDSMIVTAVCNCGLEMEQKICSKCKGTYWYRNNPCECDLGCEPAVLSRESKVDTSKEKLEFGHKRNIRQLE